MHNPLHPHALMAAALCAFASVPAHARWAIDHPGRNEFAGQPTGLPFPRPVASPGLSGFTELSASNVHALVIGPGNVVYAWGSGLRGALGDGIDGSSRTAPGMVTVP
ncbi:MAG: hypothetical protein ING89_19935 [Rubrivivax sp.]|nr:hypothetical protein [Rubrivivax sp.]